MRLLTAHDFALWPWNHAAALRRVLMQCGTKAGRCGGIAGCDGDVIYGPPIVGTRLAPMSRRLGCRRCRRNWEWPVFQEAEDTSDLLWEWASNQGVWLWQDMQRIGEPTP